jgi:hypothetical protein
MPVTIRINSKNINKFKDIILNNGKRQTHVQGPVEIIDLFATVYIVNIAEALAKILREMSIEVNVYIRDLTNDDIIKCYNDYYTLKINQTF